MQARLLFILVVAHGVLSQYKLFELDIQTKIPLMISCISLIQSVMWVRIEMRQRWPRMSSNRAFWLLLLLLWVRLFCCGLVGCGWRVIVCLFVFIVVKSTLLFCVAVINCRCRKLDTLLVCANTRGLKCVKGREWRGRWEVCAMCGYSLSNACS